ncbi:hypothetical protein Mterra_01907 [Calidithermus terrae]|uniref:DUF2993 domain-containing protein n=1 Tax=Calidithermus terrae TaxID=1408545 RepID=A0A399EIT4_9DEIN|nr:hypothetical protein [Calidithermus terrae]RIH84634.1 hypothetical protein Mterra_01907 [Calidithermus terrae]
MHLRASLTLELTQALLAHLLAQPLRGLDLPLEVRALRLSLGRLHGGEVRELRLEPGLLRLGVGFASGPHAELRLRHLGFDAPTQTLRLRVEHLHAGGFPGAMLLNLAPAKVLEVAIAQANRRLPGLLSPGPDRTLELRLTPLRERLRQEPRLREALAALGLEAKPELELRDLQFRLEQLWLELDGGF